jgi:hypothetical protein
VVSVRDNLCSKQGNSSKKSAVYNQEQVLIKVTINKSGGEVFLVENQTIECVSVAFIINFLEIFNDFMSP